jgi:hypothetical protein
MSFKEFYLRLEEWEREYGIKLVLKPEDFGMERRKRIQNPIKKGDTFTSRIVAEGRMHGEMLAVVKERVVTVLTDKKVDNTVKFEIVRAHDGIFLGKEV